MQCTYTALDKSAGGPARGGGVRTPPAPLQVYVHLQWRGAIVARAT